MRRGRFDDVGFRPDNRKDLGVRYYLDPRIEKRYRDDEDRIHKSTHVVCDHFDRDMGIYARRIWTGL